MRSYLLNDTAIWCLETAIQQFSKVILLISMLMKNNEKLNFLENEQMKNPTLTCIIHAYELLDNDFKTWALLKAMCIYIYIYISNKCIKYI